MKPLSRDGAPRQLGRFELVAELASGGMATVYLGRLGGAGGFQRFVAIKRLHSHLASDAEFVDMFLDEARLAARLHHPNVVPILEIGQSDSAYYLVMEYVEGETLARLLNLSHQAGSPVPTNVTVRIFLDVLAGLHAAHELVGDDGQPLEIVHRDVSPQNVLVGVEGAAKITDFGVAHAADRLAHTRTGQLKGKFSYMAPEQALGGVVDRRADVFAVGTCLWEALACKRLFKGDNEADTLEKVLRGPVPRLRTLNRALHPAIEEVVARALDRDANRRFRSALEFAEALERAALHAGVLGTQRDVMTHVQRVLGALLVQQREAVRAWIAGMERGGDQTPTPERGPTTRVDVPRGSPGSRREGPPSALRQEVATVAPKRAPLLATPVPPPPADPEPPVDTRPSADSSGSVAVAPVERSAVTASTARATGTSMLATYGVAALVVAIGVLVGVSRLRANAAESGADASAEPPGPAAVAVGTALAPQAANAPTAAIATVSNATTRLGAPPVPTTPLAPLSTTAPPPLVPTVGVNDLPSRAAPPPLTPSYAQPPPLQPQAQTQLQPRPQPRVAPTPRYEPEPRPRHERMPEPKPERIERVERVERPDPKPAAGGDLPDDLGRNPYR